MNGLECHHSPDQDLHCDSDGEDFFETAETLFITRLVHMLQEVSWEQGRTGLCTRLFKSQLVSQKAKACQLKPHGNAQIKEARGGK